MYRETIALLLLGICATSFATPAVEELPEEIITRPRPIGILYFIEFLKPGKGLVPLKRYAEEAALEAELNNNSVKDSSSYQSRDEAVSEDKTGERVRRSPSKKFGYGGGGFGGKGGYGGGCNTCGGGGGFGGGSSGSWSQSSASASSGSYGRGYGKK